MPLVEVPTGRRGGGTRTHDPRFAISNLLRYSASSPTSYLSLDSDASIKNAYHHAPKVSRTSTASRSLYKVTRFLWRASKLVTYHILLDSSYQSQTKPRNCSCDIMASQAPLYQRLLRRLEVNRDTDTDVDIYVNKDTRPLPPSRRTYGPWEFVGLWMITGSFNVGGWTTGSSLISLGLNVWVSHLSALS